MWWYVSILLGVQSLGSMHLQGTNTFVPCMAVASRLIWRDLSSKFDVLGPYFTSETGFDAKSLITITQETMLKFHWFGFHTAVIVVDGASSNLSMIKLWTERIKGAYSTRDGTEDKHLVKPWFIDPFNGHKVYFIICPSHQVSIQKLLSYCI